MTIRTCCLIFVAFLFSPIAVCLHLNQCCTTHVLINILLFCLLPYVGGLIHAIYVICAVPEHAPPPAQQVVVIKQTEYHD